MLFSEWNDAVFEAGSKISPWVAPETDFLPLRERSRLVVHWNLERGVPRSHQFADEFPIEIESVGLERQAKQAITTEHLEHGEGIPQPLAIDGVEEAREEEMAEVHHSAHEYLIGEVAHLPGLAVHAVTDTEDKRYASVDDWLDELIIVVDVVLEIGILYEHEI